MSHTPSVTARAALAACSVAVALLALEAFVRLADVGPTFEVVLRDTMVPSDDPQLGYELLPGAPDADARISSLGLRDREYAIPKPGQTLRIAALGDSVTYASAMRREQAWPQQLAELLQGGERPVEVPNLGVIGYNLPQIVRRLETTGLALEPDVVVYGFVLNDLQDYSFEARALDALREAQTPRTALTRSLAKSRLFLLIHNALQGLTNPGVNLSRYADPAYKVATDDERTAYYRALHSTPEAQSRLDDGLGALAKLTSQREIPVLVAIFPLFHVLEGEYPLRAVHADVARRARDHGLLALDLLDPYRSAAAAARERGIVLHGDFLHPNAAGQRVAAAAIASALAASGLLP